MASLPLKRQYAPILSQMTACRSPQNVLRCLKEETRSSENTPITHSSIDVMAHCPLVAFGSWKEFVESFALGTNQFPKPPRIAAGCVLPRVTNNAHADPVEPVMRCNIES